MAINLLIDWANIVAKLDIIEMSGAGLHNPYSFVVIVGYGVGLTYNLAFFDYISFFIFIMWERSLHLMMKFQSHDILSFKLIQKVHSSPKHVESKIIALLRILFILYLLGGNEWSYYCVIHLISVVVTWNSVDVTVV